MLSTKKMADEWEDDGYEVRGDGDAYEIPSVLADRGFEWIDQSEDMWIAVMQYLDLQSTKRSENISAPVTFA